MALPVNVGALIVTSISPPNVALRALASGAASVKMPFIIIGDTKSPNDFKLEGAEFYSIAQQNQLLLKLAGLCLHGSYARKNLGYLVAIARGAEFIVETDDDNIPKAEFWEGRDCNVQGASYRVEGWVNAYQHFSKSSVYPRGFPLEQVQPLRAEFRLSGPQKAYCPIQQALADGNPDVDAIYRMLFPLPLNFDRNTALILETGQWCPFNSQNTTFFRPAFPLLYLPTYCSFRMTDIWRSFVAQRVLWECGWNVSFHSATVFQERNAHDLLKDFKDEIPGYLNNTSIVQKLNELNLNRGEANIEANMRRCYEEFVRLDLIASQEFGLLDAWFRDLRAAQQPDLKNRCADFDER